MPRVDVSRKSLQEILSNRREPQLVLPDYQRDFVWNTEKCNQLWDDMFHHLLHNPQTGGEESTPYFLGNIIVEKRPQGGSRDLVDGQQRVTALSRIMCVVRDALLEYHSVNKDDDQDSLELATQLQERILTEEIEGDQFSIQNRLQPQDRPEGQSLSSLVQHECFLHLQHDFSDSHLEITSQENNELIVTPNQRLCWQIRKGMKLPLYRQGEPLTHTIDEDQVKVFIEFDKDVKRHQELAFSIIKTAKIFPAGVEIQDGDIIKLHFKRPEVDSKDFQDDLELYHELKDEFTKFITKEDDDFKLYPVSDFPNDQFATHIRTESQRISQFVKLIENVDFGVCIFQRNALSYFRKMNDQNKMTMLETIDLMVAVTSQVTSEKPVNQETDREIEQLWRYIFDRLYLQVDKKPGAAVDFFYTFLLSQGKSQQGRGGRYSKATSFKGLETHYLRGNIHPLTGWNKDSLVRFYRGMKELSIYFLDAYSPHSNPRDGVFAAEGVNNNRKLERYLLRMIQHSGFIQHIPMYMASCQVFSGSDRRDEFISKMLRKWVHYFLRSTSIPSGKGFEITTSGKTYNLVFKWCKLLQNRYLLPSSVREKEDRLKQFETEIKEKKNEVRDAEEGTTETLEQEIAQLENDVKSLRQRSAVICENRDIEEILQVMDSDIGEALSSLAENVPWKATKLRGLNASSTSIRLILWCDEIASWAKQQNYATGEEVPTNMTLTLPLTDVEVEHICPRSANLEDWPGWWSRNDNHSKNLESLANKMLLESTINKHISNSELDFKRKAYDGEGNCPNPGNCQHYSASQFHTADIFSKKHERFEWNKGSLDERDKQIANNLITFWSL